MNFRRESCLDPISSHSVEQRQALLFLLWAISVPADDLATRRRPSAMSLVIRQPPASA